MIMTPDEAREIEREQIVIGNQYEFYCTLHGKDGSGKLPRLFTGQTVTVLEHTNGEYADEEGYEPQYLVRTASGCEIVVWEGELDDWFKDTGQFYNPDGTYGPNKETH